MLVVSIKTNKFAKRDLRNSAETDHSSMPQHIVITNQRPDLIIWSDIGKDNNSDGTDSAFGGKPLI